MAGINEYDDMMTRGSPAPINEYDTLVADTNRSDTTALRNSMKQASTTTPDRSAEVIKLSQRMKMPAEIVNRNFDLIKSKVDVESNDYDKMLTQSPKLVEFLKSGENAAVAQDDLANLGVLEWLVTAPGRAWDQGQAQVEFGRLRNQSIFRDLSADEHKRLAELRTQMQEGGNLGVESWFGGALTGGARQLPMLFGSLVAGAKTGLPSAMGAASAVALLGQAGPQAALPEEIATVPAAAATGYYIGQTAGSARFGFEQEAGHAYEEFSKFKDELGQPLDPDIAKAASIAAGGINAGLEAFQLNTLLRTIPGTDKLSGAVTRSAISKALASATVRGALKDLMLGYGKTLTIETATEVAQRAVTIMSGEIGKAVSGQDIKQRGAADISRDLVSEAVDSAQAFTFIVAPGHATRAGMDVIKIREAKKNEAFFQALGEGVTASKTFSRLPEKLQEFIAQATKDGPIENVYMPVEAFQQYYQSKGVDPAAVANELLGSNAAYEEAVRTGADLQMPMSVYAARIAPTEANAFFAKEIRLAPDELNSREAVEFEQALAAQARQQAEVEEGRAADDSAGNVREDVIGQLIGAGYDRGTVEAYGRMYEAAFRTLGERAGVDPMQLYQRYGLRIQRPIPTILTEPRNVDQFDALLDRLRSGDMPKERDMFGLSLTEFLRERGGVQDEGGELTSRDPDKGLRPFQRRLIQPGGMSLDRAREAAQEAGYLSPDDPNAPARLDVNDLIAAISDDLGGRPVYAQGQENSERIATAQALQQLDSYLRETGVDLNSMTNEQIKKLLNEASAKQGQQGADVTFEQGDINKLIAEAEALPEYVELEKQLNAAQKKADEARADLETRERERVVKMVEQSGKEFDREFVDSLTQHFVMSELEKGALSSVFAKANEIEGQMRAMRMNYISERLPKPSKYAEQINRAPRPQEETEAFKKWFAGSKAVGKDGRPLIALHGTDRDFDTFDTTISDTRHAFNKAINNPDWGGSLGTWFTTPSLHEGNYDIGGSEYMAGEFSGATGEGDKAPGAVVYPVYLSVKNPVEFDGYEHFQDVRDEHKSLKAFRKALIADGHDGIVIRNSMTDGNVDRDDWVTFYPQQVKSAIGNRGTFDPLSGNILHQITPDQARSIDMETKLPSDPLFAKAVANTPGAEIEADGLRIDVVRFQKPEQAGEESVRTGVFYLPAGSKDAKHYKGSKHGYGGNDRISGPTLLRAPLFVKGATGGRAPELAYDSIKGKGAYQAMRDDVIETAVGYGSRKSEADIAAVLEKYGADPSMAYSIASNSTQGNTLAYAMQENIVAHAVRGAGHDAVVGYSVARKTGEPFISEIFDVRETTYPIEGEDGTLHDVFSVKRMDQVEDTGDKRGRIRFGKDRQFNIDLLERADLSTFIHESGHFYLEVIGDVVDELKAADPASMNETQSRMVEDYGKLLKWLGVESREQIGVPQHEKWARGLEAYMREGKAPSVELRSIFARFRSWLINIYRSLTSLNVQLSDEVREVMDRVFASDQEIEAATKEAEIAPLFTDASSAGMTDAEFKAYRETVQGASDRARDELQAKLVKQYTREHDKWWKAERETVAADVAAEVYQRPEYVALSVMRDGKMPDGSELPEGIAQVKLDRAALAEVYGKEFLKRLPRGTTTKDGGINPDTAAELFGFTSGDALVTAIVNARPMKQLIEAEADVRMRDRYGDMRTDGTMADAARLAVQNNERAKVIHAELKALRKKQREVAPFVAAERQRQAARTREGVASIQGIPPIAMFTRMAEGRIAQMLARDLKPMNYLMAARRAGKKAIEAAAKNDFEVAAVEKQRELLNVELYRAAQAAREEVDGIVDYMQSFGQAKKRARIAKAGQDYLDQIDGLLDRFEFARIPLKVLERRKALAAWMAEKERQGIPVNLPDEIVDESRRVNYKDMTVEEMRGMNDSVKHIEHLARLKNRLLKAKAKRELDEVVTEIDLSIRDNTVAKARQIETRLPGDDAARLVNGFFASHRKLSSLARQMDGFKDGGVVWEYVLRPLNDAADAEATMNAEATQKLTDLFAAYKGKDISALYRKQEIPAIGASLTKMGRLMVALNWGNEGNRSRIMDGYAWNETQVAAILDTLDERDWQFVQGVWDLINSYWPEIEAKQKRVEGIAPEKVAPTEVVTRFGTFRGGYFPIKYDDRQSAKAGANLDSEFADIAKAASYVRASTRRGHTEARVDKVEMPVRLDFGVIFEHVAQVIHDLSHHEMLIDAGRIVGHKTVQSAIYDTYGEVVYKEIKSTLLDVAFGEPPAITPFEKSINWVRQGATIAGLGWNVMTSLMQPLGLAQSIVRVGPKWVGKGLSRWMRDTASFENTAHWINDRSEFMRLRSKTQLREINEIRNRVGLTTGKLSGWVDEALRTVTADHATKQGIADSFFWLIHKGQQVADIPTWIGAYEKAMSEGNAEERSIALSDQAVKDSQGGGQIHDLAGIQRGGPLLKLWTNFYSYFNVTWNLSVESARRTNYRDPVSMGRLAVDFLLLYTLPATLTALMKHALTGGDDDDEKLVAKLIRENLSYMLGVMVGLREIGSAVQGFHGYEGPAGTRFFSAVSKLVKQADQGELDAAFWRALNDTAGVLLHYPAGQVRRSIEGFVALQEGKTRNPMALLVGPPKE